mmetsp:Transcript_42662/g.77919  ORF Transcript_42662/g.77919 Transcript_42662/m.77919 type:complete len:139 (-) Transcript_42662:47-463(-)
MVKRIIWAVQKKKSRPELKMIDLGKLLIAAVGQQNQRAFRAAIGRRSITALQTRRNPAGGMWPASSVGMSVPRYALIKVFTKQITIMREQKDNQAIWMMRPFDKATPGQDNGNLLLEKEFTFSGPAKPARNVMHIKPN